MSISENPGHPSSVVCSAIWDDDDEPAWIQVVSSQQPLNSDRNIRMRSISCGSSGSGSSDSSSSNCSTISPSNAFNAPDSSDSAPTAAASVLEEQPAPREAAMNATSAAGKPALVKIFKSGTGGTERLLQLAGQAPTSTASDAHENAGQQEAIGMGDAAPDYSADSPSTSSKPQIRQTAAEGAAPASETGVSPTDDAAAEAAQAPRAKSTDSISNSEPRAKQPPPREVAGAVPSRAARAAGGSAAAAAPAQSAAGGGGGGSRRWACIVGAAAFAAALHVLLFAPELRALGWLPLPLLRWSRGRVSPVAALPCRAPQLSDGGCIAQAPSDAEGRGAAAERAGARSNGTVADPWRVPEDGEPGIPSSGDAERRDLDVFEAALHQLGQEVHTLKRHAHTNAALPRALYQIEVRVTAMEAALRTAAAEREQLAQLLAGLEERVQALDKSRRGPGLVGRLAGDLQSWREDTRNGFATAMSLF